MKEKILIFIIGLLLGAVLASTSFLIYTKSTNTNNNTQMNQPGGQPPEMNGNNQGNPPERPDGDNSSTPPEKPNENNNSNN